MKYVRGGKMEYVPQARLTFIFNHRDPGYSPQELITILSALPPNSKIVDVKESYNKSPLFSAFTFIVENEMFKDGQEIEPIFFREAVVVNGHLKEFNRFGGLDLRAVLGKENA